MQKLLVVGLLVGSFTMSNAGAAPLPDTDLPFEFPAVAKTDAKAGQNAFALNMKLIRNDFNAGKKSFGTQFLLVTVKEPGDKASLVSFVGDDKVPNSGIIAIPAKVKLKKGDIVAAKWAVNMTRGIVVDANPKAPKVKFIGIDYDNPAKADDKKTGIGVFDYTVTPGEILPISKPYDPASSCAVKQADGSYKVMEIFRAVGDRVMGIVFTDFTSVKKADCIALPLKPKYKVGAVVWAPWVGNMSKGKITAIDVGRFKVKFDESFKKEAMVAFGDVIDKLP
jgi:hypothetical protein